MKELKRNIDAIDERERHVGIFLRSSITKIVQFRSDEKMKDPFGEFVFWKLLIRGSETSRGMQLQLERAQN